ncbi:MAG: BrxE family protein [bacterium]|nr:BrxE family protein [bacterium]
MTQYISTDNLTPKEIRIILGLRLLIARAANKDSLAWWDDESFSTHAEFLLDRIFPMAPPLAARSLSLAAAIARHRAACTEETLHLYHLDFDNQDGLALRFEPLLPVPVPEEPITTLETLRQHLIDLTGNPVHYTVDRKTSTHGLQIEIPPCPPGTSPLAHRAQALAWAYLESAPGAPVFPFCLE